MRVAVVMTRHVISNSPEATVAHAVELMLKNHISGLPVVDDMGHLAGIVTEADFLHRPETGTERRPLVGSMPFLARAKRPTTTCGLIVERSKTS